MKFPDETLMAYADGELDEEASRAIEESMKADPEVAGRVAQHRALRAELGAVFAGVLEEPVPGTLRTAAYASPPRTEVVSDLASAREARSNTARRRSAWKEWSAIAASVAMGILVGRTVLHPPESELVAMSDAGLVASGALNDALSNQVGSQPREDAEAAITVTFLAKSGEYCRAFKAASAAGVACRERDAWRVHTLTQPGASAGEYRMAGSALPLVVSQTVEAMMVGDALDPEQEAAARARDWRN